MNCTECKQLFDAYLDGNLAGSLRLEFDAHRLRCRHCQQSLAMLEAVGDVLSSDPDVPPLSTDFSDRVIDGIRTPAPRTLRFPRRRVTIVAAALIQAAAVVSIAVFWPSDAPQPSDNDAATPYIAANTGDELDAGKQALRELIFERVEDRIWAMHAAGEQLSNDFLNLAAYANLTLPDDVVRESSRMAGGNPLELLMNSLVPTPTDEPDASSTVGDVHSL